MKRREALSTLGVAGAAVLAGCAPASTSSNAGTSTTTTGSSPATQSAGSKVASLEDFKAVGAFKEVTAGSTPVVISRVAGPQKGGLSVGDVHLVALSRICTHLGCFVGSPKDGVLGCGCHGSVFDATTGAVKQGPANQPLKAFTLEARADGIYLVG